MSEEQDSATIRGRPRGALIVWEVACERVIRGPLDEASPIYRNREALDGFTPDRAILLLGLRVTLGMLEKYCHNYLLNCEWGRHA